MAPRKTAEPVPDHDNPELTDADFARARPFCEMHPEAFAAWQLHGSRVTVVTEPKVQVGLRLAADVAAAVKATGRGYSARVERILRDAIRKGQL